jgi:primosomal protein N' (replication factor Y)
MASFKASIIYLRYMKIAQILTPNLGLLDYLIPNDMKLKRGNFVIVPFRNKLILACIWNLSNTSEVEINKLRYIESVTNFSLSEIDLEFMSWVAEYYLFSLGIVFKMVIPSYIANFILKGKPHKDLGVKAEPIYTKPNFNPEQIDAIDQIKELLLKQKHNIIIDGVTGSGKTEIYLAAINEALKQDKLAQILIMLPEISLTSQITDRIFQRFNYIPYVWHSGVSDKQKRDNFLKILSGQARIIIGARSALFLPYNNLKMIIVDEEHEQSYKQEDGVTYQARDMAIMRAKLGCVPVILASASPSLESVHNVNLGKLNLVSLIGRYNDQAMPKIHILDMKKEKRKNYYISPVLVESLKANLLNHQQSLLFLNRKGYSPMLICNQCGFRVCCKNCSTGMVYHKSQKKLKCHQCGYVAALPKECAHCHAPAESFMPCGPGIEKLTEEVKELLPNARIVTLTQESFANSKQADILLNAITNREYDIILGTQIIAKGHHFPSLTIVGIIDADSGMMSGDLRCAEKNYQLLQQVSGRAGRELSNSQIFIQTYNPHNPLILALASYNRERFIIEEMRSRQATQMPPFGRLAAIIISSKQEQKLIEVAKQLVKLAPISKEIIVLGAAQALIYKIRGSFRYRILLKTKRNINIQKYINTWLNEIKLPSHINIKIDIDPYYFL